MKKNNTSSFIITEKTLTEISFAALKTTNVIAIPACYRLSENMKSKTCQVLNDTILIHN